MANRIDELTFYWAFLKVATVEWDAFYYKGDMLPKVIKAYVYPCEHLERGKIVVKPSLMLDVQYHTKGHCALYSVRLDTGEFCVAED